MLLDHLVVDTHDEKCGSHCPTNSANASLPAIFKIAEVAIELNAAAKYPPEGTFEVWDSIAPVTRSELLYSTGQQFGHV